MYLDSAYVAKYYVNEPDSLAVRKLVRKAQEVRTSAWALIEVICVFHRHVREGSLTAKQGRELIDLFRRHTDDGIWGLVPVTPALLQRTAELVRALPENVPLRAADALHLRTAIDAGETEIWTNDRHLLAAAARLGLSGRSVS